MIDTTQLTKHYYSIGEVAEMFRLSKSLIRYWETEFTFLNPRKNKKGDRLFTKENIEQLQIIHSLVKNRGFTLEGAKRELRKHKKRLKRQQELVRELQSLRKQMQDLHAQLGGS